MEYIYQCEDCVHNKGEDNQIIEFCEVCEEGHCILCVWKHERFCKDYQKK